MIICPVVQLVRAVYLLPVLLQWVGFTQCDPSLSPLAVSATFQMFWIWIFDLQEISPSA